MKTEKIPIFDHGYIQIIETWGSDEMVVESARMSTDGAFRGWGDAEKPGDEKLLRFLYEKKHSTPFEMAGATIEVQAPIVVFREWHRHRTQSYSELSARYAPLPNFNYMPDMERCMILNTANKQAGAVKGSDALTPERTEEWLKMLQKTYDIAEQVYQTGLQWGIPKEVARLPVPVGRYSRMRASANLRNWMGFLTLRNAPDAQLEIRRYAEVLTEMMTAAFPRSIALWEEGRS